MAEYKRIAAKLLWPLVCLIAASCGERRAPASRTGGPASEKPEPVAKVPDIEITATDEDYCTVYFSIIRDEVTSLYSVGSNGKGFKKIVDAEVKSPAWVSPNGKRITFNSHSSEMREDCQAVYDSERDTLIMLRQPHGGVGWYPRWWDDNHIYYRSMGHIYIQNIHSGEYTKITTEKIRKWLDPVWVPELGRFVNVEGRRICTFKKNGTEYECDSLPCIHQTAYTPVVVQLNGAVMVAFETATSWYREGETRPRVRFVIVDLHGDIHFENDGYPNLQHRIGETACDPSGKWIYFIDEMTIGGSTVALVKRHAFGDRGREQVVFYNVDSNFNLMSVSRE